MFKKETEVKTILVEAKCSCSIGNFKYKNEKFGDYSFWHECDHCHTNTSLDRIYPYLKYEKVQ